MLLVLAASPLLAQQPRIDALQAEIDRRTTLIVAKLADWRHDIHQHPELSFQETRTAALVANHLKSLGLEVRTGVGGNGVVGVLRGGRPGPVVGLRAEMDALPVVEQVNVPFKSTVRTVYNGVETGVMHACGHDMHTAMLMGTAEVLAGMKAQLPGTVVFLFQPAEEAPPKGGAGPMIADGALDNPKVDVVFGLHVGPGALGTVHANPGATTSAADGLRIVVHGRQTHGAFPSAGVDPIVVGAQIVLGLQTIVSRQVNMSTAPAVVTIGAFQGGLRENIIPDSVWMIGTIRTLDEGMRNDIHMRVARTAEEIAKSAGATADGDDHARLRRDAQRHVAHREDVPHPAPRRRPVDGLRREPEQCRRGLLEVCQQGARPLHFAGRHAAGTRLAQGGQQPLPALPGRRQGTRHRRAADGEHGGGLHAAGKGAVDDS